ncbi:prepilin-type N-terminal cleavage/methylation domain-containing protein [Sinimarinibacterium sp. CAU 1509]|uniref:prepilin-type N-terminal cleavage/methylation domain-containing protein n=1 Tax=Sinimarinibacterium sp. CAU 1509 TaxID=2562283 RepID=UPI0010ABB704|nr:prepilin-type N-terminal cleavage/methylation domain-containing protein [Sinimarinibacterium sp. CAU 1509]TJY62073.1 prepilin-type N-terminal cleavage/methylation domain-containing protein [Sinimarinibacterium sp. CAU 1509]
MHIHQRGLSLVELMVALVAGLLLAGVGTSLLVNSLSADTTNMRYTRLNQDLRSVLNSMTHDIARAGQWGLADQVVHLSKTTELSFSGDSGTVTATGLDSETSSTKNAFAGALANGLVDLTLFMLPSTGTRIDGTIESVPDADTLSVTINASPAANPGPLPETRIYAQSWTVLNPFGVIFPGSADPDVGSCIIVSYDLNGDGLYDDDHETFGYRYDATDKAIRISTGETSCTSGDWYNLTDPDFVEIPAGGFQVTRIRTAATASNQLVGSVDEYLISISGTLKSDTAVTRSLSAAVKVRNNAFH